MTDTLLTIQNRITELEAQLSSSPVYQELQILRNTKEQLMTLKGSIKATSSGIIASETPNVVPKGYGHVGARVTMLEGVRLALEEYGRPMGTRELVNVLPRFGARVGGIKPHLNLGSILSKRGNRFQSVTWNDQPCWWFRDRILPNDLLDDSSSPKETADTEQQMSESAAPRHPNQGGSHGPPIA